MLTPRRGLVPVLASIAPVVNSGAMWSIALVQRASLCSQASPAGVAIDEFVNKINAAELDETSCGTLSRCAVWRCFSPTQLSRTNQRML